MTGTAVTAPATPRLAVIWVNSAAGDKPFLYGWGQVTIPLGNNAARNSYRSAKATREQITCS